SGWKLIIVGDGEARNMYYQLAKELQLRNISFEGRQNPLMYYQKAAIFMMTSITEGFGLTLTEAQQNGVVPIAANTFPSLGDIIQSGYSGIIVPDGDVKLYADSLYELMNNSKLRQKLAKSAVESSRRFTLESICAQWYDLFIQVLGEKE
ncbi:glycosyltransferase, partial [Bacteroides thetaiotaomicron]